MRANVQTRFPYNSCTSFSICMMKVGTRDEKYYPTELSLRGGKSVLCKDQQEQQESGL